MITLDDRGGSGRKGRSARRNVERKYALPLRRLGLPVSIERLPFADVAFDGRGPNGQPFSVGIELKTFEDLVGSFHTDRLRVQLAGMCDMYDYVFLVVEGDYRVLPDGSIVLAADSKGKKWAVPRGTITNAQLQGLKNTLLMRAGIPTETTRNANATIEYIRRLYLWGTTKAWEDHTSHLSVSPKEQWEPQRDSILYVKKTAVRHTAERWPGVSRVRADKLSKHFADVVACVNAPMKQFQKILGKVIGKRVWCYLHGVKCHD
jgi:ERCC4-type nuclease